MGGGGGGVQKPTVKKLKNTKQSSAKARRGYVLPITRLQCDPLPFLHLKLSSVSH